jgi:hypothetical protein
MMNQIPFTAMTGRKVTRVESSGYEDTVIFVLDDKAFAAIGWKPDRYEDGDGDVVDVMMDSYINLLDNQRILVEAGVVTEVEIEKIQLSEMRNAKRRQAAHDRRLLAELKAKYPDKA